jgi:hypothetical protein
MFLCMQYKLDYLCCETVSPKRHPLGGRWSHPQGIGLAVVSVLAVSNYEGARPFGSRLFQWTIITPCKQTPFPWTHVYILWDQWNTTVVPKFLFIYIHIQHVINIAREQERRRTTTEAHICFCTTTGSMTIKEFELLALDGHNYPTWAVDVKVSPASRGLYRAVLPPEGGVAPLDDQHVYTTLYLIRSHIHLGLKSEYLLEENPRNLWNSLKQRYEQQKALVLPTANFQWTQLRL